MDIQQSGDFECSAPLTQGLIRLVQKADEALSSRPPVDRVQMYLAGGMAVYLYTATRVTGDVDAEFSHRLLLPENLSVEIPIPHQEPAQVLYFDRNYNSSFALMHPDYKERAEWVFSTKHFDVRVLSPVDLVLSKLVRFSPNDQSDIKHLLEACSVNHDKLQTLFDEALDYFIGDVSYLQPRLKWALSLCVPVSSSPSIINKR